MVGVLRPVPKDVDQFAEPFRRYMRAIGWEDGRNVRFLFVWAEGRNERAPALAEQLIAKNVDVIVAFADPAIRAVQRATTLALRDDRRLPPYLGAQHPAGRHPALFDHLPYHQARASDST